MRFVVAIAAAFMFLASCGGSPADVGFAPPSRACTPGAQVECACPGDAPKGVQSCRADGSGYDACACTVNVDAGASGGDSGGAPTGPDGGGSATDGGTVTLPDGAVVMPDGGACSGALDSDSENCGACGHSCLGAACQAGVCAFVTLASNQPAVSGLAVGGGSVFWTTEGTNPDYVGSVFALSLANPSAAPAVLAAGSQNYPRALTFADGALYWGAYGDGAIGKWTASAGTYALGTAPGGRLYNVVADSAFVYFSMEIANRNTVSGGVGRCPLDGCVGAPELVATADAKIIGLAIDQGVLFWSVYSSSGAVYALKLDGASSPRAIAVGQASPLNIAAFGGLVYWVNAASGTVARMSADDSGDASAATLTILAKNQPTPWGIAADAEGVYWTTYTPAGQIMKLPHGSTSPIVLASAQPNPGHVRTDTAFAYWTNTGDGSIRRVPK